MKYKFKKLLVQLIRQHSSPREIALGAGIGAFICILPLYGLHTVLAIIAAILVKPANKIAIFLGTSLSLPPTIPFITWAAYEIGRLLVDPALPPLSWEFFKQLTFQKAAKLYWPLFLGSLILGLICGAIVYLVTFYAVKIIKQRQKRGNKNKKIRTKRQGPTAPDRP